MSAPRIGKISIDFNPDKTIGILLNNYNELKNANGQKIVFFFTRA